MILESDYILSGKINEECGVFGVYNVKDAASLTYFGLHALQHRGQESSGIATMLDGNIKNIKGKGLLTDTFDSKMIESLKGNYALGHVRYATASNNEYENIQPVVIKSHRASFAVSHNGSIVNAKELRKDMEKKGSIFHGTSDAELIAHLILREHGSLAKKIENALNYLEGAFAFVVMCDDALYAIRDKTGLRPLSIAKIDDGYCVSSESCAFDIVNGQDPFDVVPGEIVTIDKKGISKHFYTSQTQHKMCAMEYIYFSRPDSSIDGINVHTARRLSGRKLAEIDMLDNDLKADIVVGVPDSSLSAAMGYAEKSGLSYEIGLIKNRYVGRTFIQPTQELRERGVRMKLSAVRDIVNGKRIILVDDSIVRGTTSKRITQLLKDAGAKEVHVRIGSPTIDHPCFYGVDTSSKEELISAHMNIEELRKFINADSLKFLSIEQMMDAFNTKNLCVACFSGKYPTPLFSHQDKLDKEQ
ncbi:MAG: amidophosphoribosyltransferase [Anaerorhabdus sp.]